MKDKAVYWKYDNETMSVCVCDLYRCVCVCVCVRLCGFCLAVSASVGVFVSLCLCVFASLCLCVHLCVREYLRHRRRLINPE